jgi:hypothetical protein
MNMPHKKPPADQAGPASEACPPLPEEYEVDVVDLIPCRPNLILVAWELGGAAGRRMRERLTTQVDWVVRVIDVEGDTENDVPVEPLARRHYLHVEPDRTYRVELGVCGPGGYHTVCEGGEVEMPATKPAEEQAVEWVDFHPAPYSNTPESPPEEPGSRPPRGVPAAGLEWDPDLIVGASSTDLPPRPEEADEDEA